MIIKVRTLQGLQKEVNVKANETILDLKKKVEEVMPEMESSKQKLIFGGRILEDTAVISDTLQENDAVIAMINRKNTFKNPSTNTDANRNANEEDASATANTNKNEVVAPITPVAPPKENDGGDVEESILLTGEQLRETINHICDMGFEREDVERAMRNAYNNPSRAIDYLTGRLAETAVEGEVDHANGNEEDYEDDEEKSGGGYDYGEDGEGNIYNALETDELNLPSDYVLDFLTDGQGVQFLSNPNFINFLSNVAMGNPQRISEMLEVIERTEPELLQYIRENQANIINIIQQFRNVHVSDSNGFGNLDSSFPMNIPEDLNEQLTDAATNERLTRDNTEGVEGAEENTLPSTIALTEKELESVNKLEALGFPKHVALEAFIACDKNEELAANYLFENMDQEGA